MDSIKDFFNKKIFLAIVSCLLPVIVLFILIITIVGFATGEAIVEDRVNGMRFNTFVNGNQIFVAQYKNLLNKYLLTKGYVSLERLVFYLQRTTNVLNVATLSVEQWEQAYLKNVNAEEKQMIPIKTMCKELNSDTSLPEFTIQSGTTNTGLPIEVKNLCVVDGVDITTSNDYDELYLPLPYTFPLKSDFTITSIVFENRSIDLGLSLNAQANVNFHSGWDLAVPIGTEFYSICDGTVSNITNTQEKDVPYSQSANSTGNYMTVKCDNELTAIYGHLKYKSQPSTLKVGSIVKKGELLGKTSTTGLSTGPHLHLELKDSEGTLLDAMAYINFTNYEGTN